MINIAKLFWRNFTLTFLNVLMLGKAIGSLNNKLKNILIRIFGAAVCMSMILTAIGILLPDELVSLKFTDSKSIAYNFGMLPITFKIEESCKCYY